MTLLHTEHLTKYYGRCCALDGLGLTMAAGEILGLLGPNGSGKSTALRLLLGFLRPSAGWAAISGHDCWHDSVAVRQQVAYLPGELRLYENMTGRQLVKFLGRLRQEVVRHDVDELARQLDIDLDRPIRQLSSGMKRKVALLQVLLPRVPLLLLDEPTNTLDPVMRDELLAQLRQARNRGQAVLFSSHVLNEVEQVCDRVVILQRGRLVHLQDMTELRRVHRVSVRFHDAAPAPPTVEELMMRPAPTGVSVSPLQVPPDCDWLRITQCQGDRLTLEYRGELPPLLGWLAGQPVADLHVEPLGLSEIYHRYHGTAV
jgi:ABC-2 type transport system ATP-binding protein